MPFLQPGPLFEPTCIAVVSAVARKPVFGVFDPVSKTKKSSCKDILLHARIQVSACVGGRGGRGSDFKGYAFEMVKLCLIDPPIPTPTHTHTLTPRENVLDPRILLQECILVTFTTSMRFINVEN